MLSVNMSRVAGLDEAWVRGCVRLLGLTEVRGRATGAFGYVLSNGLPRAVVGLHSGISASGPLTGFPGMKSANDVPRLQILSASQQTTLELELS